MNLNHYFEPVELIKPDDRFITGESVFGKNLTIHTPNSHIDEISNYKLALFGVPEERNSYNKGTEFAPDSIRNRLYQLFRINEKTKIIDLGNLKPGNTFTDTYFGLRDVIGELLINQVVSVIIGGSQDLTNGCFMGFEKTGKPVNLVTIDSTIDLNNSPSGSDSYLSVLFEDRRLFSYTNIGHQQYLTSEENLEEIARKNFDSFRLGSVRNQTSLTEPVLRDANLVSMDIGSVKQGDSPGRLHASPNGFHADEICQIARYAGTSDRITVFGLFEMNPRFDINNQSANLSAQIIWHFIDGFGRRHYEFPEHENQDFKKFIISHEDMEHDLVFFKSLRTERWWMEIPEVKASKNIVVSCSQEDYNQACNHDIPDRWWKLFQKIN